jgi:hypothetical protein
MITTIILSEDNAVRLHLLLESLHRNGGNLFDITVLYRGSSNEFFKGYEKAAIHFNGKNRYSHTFPVRWIEMEHSSVAKNVLSFLPSARDLVCIFNDENILFKNPPSFTAIKTLFDEHDPLALSLRLGNNTVIQNPYNADEYFSEIPPDGEFVLDQFLVWDAASVAPYTNFGIPFSINGHIYKNRSLAKILDQSSSSKIDDLEPEIQPIFYNNLYDGLPSTLSCLEYSIAIHNSSQKIADTDHQPLGLGLEDLNKRYLQSQTIDLDYITFDHISMPFEHFVLRFH